jgi:hypothetical protein
LEHWREVARGISANCPQNPRRSVLLPARFRELSLELHNALTSRSVLTRAVGTTGLHGASP